MDEAKKLVHQITNNAQIILGYLELSEHEKALVAVKESIQLLKQLTQRIGTAYKPRRKKKNGK